MRLINADRLKRSFEANTPIAFQDCVPGIHAVIDLEPTVEAIPIEWLLKKQIPWTGADDMDWIVEAEKINIVIRHIIEWWKREQAEGKEE